MSLIAPLKPFERAAATQATADKFRGKPLSFADGVTCLHMLREHMLAFGYSPPLIPAFADLKGARRALRSTGHRTIRGLLRQVLGNPVPAAQMRIGDVIVGPGQPFEAIGINVGGGKFLGWLDDGSLGMVNVVPDHAAILGAWKLL
jgi:hypothetical protein